VPSFLQLAIPGMEGPSGPEQRIEAICTSIQRLARYEPECVLCLSGPLGTRSPEEGRAVVVDGLRRAADAAREAGVRLGFEPIHPSQHDTAGFVCTLADALSILDEAGLDDVGIMVDTYNLVGEDPAEIAALSDRITGVHVADELSEPAPGVRSLPDAEGRSTAFVGALRDMGWDGTLDVEIFSTPDAFWSLPPTDAARAAYASAVRLCM
jgi:sugar phosphate isomerase/epimerase